MQAQLQTRLLMRTLPYIAVRIRIAGIGQVALLSMSERHKLPVVSVTRNDRFWCFGSRLTAVVLSSENIDHLALLGWLLKMRIYTSVAKMGYFVNNPLI